jgi:predicted Zn-dependent protease
VRIDPFPVAVPDAPLYDQASGVRLALLTILDREPMVELTDGTAADVTSVSARLRRTPEGIEVIPFSGTVSGAAQVVPDASGALDAVLRWVSAQARVPLKMPSPSAAAVNAWVDALGAHEKKDDGKAEASLRLATTSDPQLLPAQLMAMDLFVARNNEKEAFLAARQVLLLDPDNLPAARIVTRGALGTGDVAQAFVAMKTILKVNANDIDTLNVIGRYAAATGDLQKMEKTIARLRSAPPNEVAVHEPDILVAAGKVSPAIEKYYDLEVATPENPALNFKIGRLSVLRHTMTVAEIELQKLARTDPAYGRHLLAAYVYAASANRPGAVNELKLAGTASRVGDDYWTSAAEVYAMFGDDAATVAALEKAVERGEPAAAAVDVNPLFDYLRSNEQFAAIRVRLKTRKDEMRAAVSQIAL